MAVLGGRQNRLIIRVGLTARFSNPDPPPGGGRDEGVVGSVGEPRGVVREQTRLNGAQVAELLEAYGSGVATADLLERFRIGKSTLHRIVRSRGAARRNPEVTLTPRELELMREAYENGETLNELAERFGVGRSTAQRRLVALGVVMRPRGRSAS